MEQIEFRCPNVMHGIRKGNLFEVKCRHWRCKNREKNKVVLHYYDIDTGELVKTIEYKDPVKREAASGSGTDTKGKVENVNSVA